jgi:hypothetical protein
VVYVTTLPGAMVPWCPLMGVSCEGGHESLALEPQPAPKDPAGVGRFASDPGKFDYDEIQGEHSVTLGDQVVTRPFAPL